MFLNFIKDYFLLKLIKNNLHNVKIGNEPTIVKTVGLLIDESDFFKKDAIINELVANGVMENSIKAIVYRNKVNKSEGNSQLVFSKKHLCWNSQIANLEINSFINEDFDLLISYYDVEKAFLLKVTQSSNAKFKVGFSLVDKRLNHLMINTNIENHAVFVRELFKYLKILQKI